MRLEQVIEIVRCLNAASIRYIAAGGLAVNAHGFVRYTNDLDLIVSLAPDNIRRALDILATLGYRPRVPVTSAQFADQELRETWIKEKGMVVLNLWSDKRKETPIDVFVREPFDFAEEWAAAIRFPLAEGIAIPVVTLPTLFRMKQAAGRPQDRIDIDELTTIERIRHDT
jgi:hypothetical protein